MPDRRLPFLLRLLIAALADIADALTAPVRPTPKPTTQEDA